ncbi:Tetratricopeptide repeat-containing protein [Marininema mesophilum]|uniref:Tetratricopeptide repeat-containing protein n=1 Tax=Marininema mesophilum TaxID=1048340 RepID=A0A1H3BAE3_9BACL|nr:helix-turn-helix transcriptional regulator [Marininema mesophilum]SDX38658.1 Tetratricopeptide repeat-containing protein [Marininema mesophilum]
MEPSKIKDVGEAIRRVRKSKGLRLEDLADENISPATISNIERGITHVNVSKVYYIVEKLGVSMSEIPFLLLEQQDELNELRFTLDSIETLIELEGDSVTILAQLNQIELEDSHVYAALLQYIKGKHYRYEQNWKKAERCYGLAISLSNQNNDKDNMEAISFLDLSMCCYFQNEMEKALEFVNSGLDAFYEDDDRQYVKFKLLRNKVIFLERLGKNVEGLKVIQDVWDTLEGGQDTDTILTFYAMRAELLRKVELVDEAIHFAKEGLRLARMNKHYIAIFDLLTVLGNLYTTKEQWKKAEHCFNNSLASRHLKNEESLTDNYIGLGILKAQQKKMDEAKSLFQQAITNAENHTDAPKLTYALRVMGDLLKDNGTKLEAVPYYERALELAQKINHKRAESQLHIRLSQCYEDNDQKEFEKSLLNIYKTHLELKKGRDDILEKE